MVDDQTRIGVADDGGCAGALDDDVGRWQIRHRAGVVRASEVSDEVRLRALGYPVEHRRSANRSTLAFVRSYGQFCPIARGSEIFAERWTPIILRNLLLGCRTFNEIAAGAPGLSRALLTRRLRELQRVGLVDIYPKPDGRGSRYEPTPAAEAMWPVLQALSDWAQRWTNLTTEHADPDAVLWSWARSYLRTEVLPKRRVVVRFDFHNRGRRSVWLLVEHGGAEICRFDPGFGDDVTVRIDDPIAFARWHLGDIEWADAVCSGAITVEGPRDLRRALPTWNRAPEAHAAGRRDPTGAARSLSVENLPGT